MYFLYSNLSRILTLLYQSRPFVARLHPPWKMKEEVICRGLVIL